MYKLPDLPYAYDALEPHIDAQTMEIHYTKHHQGYVDKLNAALEGRDDIEEQDINHILANLNAIPGDIQMAVRNNAGGYANHMLFWEILSPDGGGEPSGDLAQAISNTFGSFEKFRQEFEAAALARFGSGWAWLAVDGDDNLIVMNTANQDSPLSEGNMPILGLDVWEHAYYLKYQNRRPEYVSAIWNIINWPAVEKNYQIALG